MSSNEKATEHAHDGGPAATDHYVAVSTGPVTITPPATRITGQTYSVDGEEIPQYGLTITGE